LCGGLKFNPTNQPTNQRIQLWNFNRGFVEGIDKQSNLKTGMRIEKQTEEDC